jgi:hypothetical protein
MRLPSTIARKSTVCQPRARPRQAHGKVLAVLESRFRSACAPELSATRLFHPAYHTACPHAAPVRDCAWYGSRDASLHSELSACEVPASIPRRSLAARGRHLSYPLAQPRSASVVAAGTGSIALTIDTTRTTVQRVHSWLPASYTSLSSGAMGALRAQIVLTLRSVLGADVARASTECTPRASARPPITCNPSFLRGLCMWLGTAASRQVTLGIVYQSRSIRSSMR